MADSGAEVAGEQRGLAPWLGALARVGLQPPAPPHMAGGGRAVMGGGVEVMGAGAGRPGMGMGADADAGAGAGGWLAAAGGAAAVAASLAACWAMRCLRAGGTYAPLLGIATLAGAAAAGSVPCACPPAAPCPSGPPLVPVLAGWSCSQMVGSVGRQDASPLLACLRGRGPSPPPPLPPLPALRREAGLGQAEAEDGGMGGCAECAQEGLRGGGREGAAAGAEGAAAGISRRLPAWGAAGANLSGAGADREGNTASLRARLSAELPNRLGGGCMGREEKRSTMTDTLSGDCSFSA